MTAAAAKKQENPAAGNLEAVEALRRDADRVLQAMLPPVDELFPGMRPEIAQFYFGQISLGVMDDLLDATHWWDKVLAERERVYLCRLAKLDAAIGAKKWNDVVIPDRARLIARFMWLRSWVLSMHPPLYPYLETVFL